MHKFQILGDTYPENYSCKSKQENKQKKLYLHIFLNVCQTSTCNFTEEEAKLTEWSTD